MKTLTHADIQTAHAELVQLTDNEGSTLEVSQKIAELFAQWGHLDLVPSNSEEESTLFAHVLCMPIGTLVIDELVRHGHKELDAKVTARRLSGHIFVIWENYDQAKSGKSVQYQMKRDERALSKDDVYRAAIREARQRGDNTLDTFHLLLALCEFTDTYYEQLLGSVGISLDDLRIAVLAVRNNPATPS